MQPTTHDPDDIDLRIDRDQLDNELMRHPDLVEQIGKGYVMACSIRDMFEAEKKAAIADISIKVRDRMKKNDPRATVQAIDAEVDRSPEVVKLNKRSVELATRARLWDVANDRVRARGYMLHKLVDLTVIFGAAVAGTSENADRGSAKRKRREIADETVQDAVKQRLKGQGK